MNLDVLKNWAQSLFQDHQHRIRELEGMVKSLRSELLILRRKVAIEFVIPGGGAAITAGIKGFIQMPFAGTITGWSLLPDQSGTIVVDIWKDTYANYPPTVADTITASAKPTITATTKATSRSLTGWTTAFARDDCFAINVDSNPATSITRCTLVLFIDRT